MLFHNFWSHSTGYVTHMVHFADTVTAKACKNPALLNAYSPENIVIDVRHLQSCLCAILYVVVRLSFHYPVIAICSRCW